MKYNLKKTETTVAETLTHLLTVIKITLEEVDDLTEENKMADATKKWKEAERYLKGYIKELFNQNK